MRRPVPLALVAGLVCATIVVACGSDESGPDPESFCARLEDGVGIGTDDAEVDPAEFAQLLEVAPEEVAPAVEKLANTAQTLAEIDETDLDLLFAAAFDPEADRARQQLLTYADEQCGIEVEGISDGRVASDLELRTELRRFLADNFATETWITRLDIDFRRRNGALDSIVVDFTADPEADDDPVEACNAVSLYLYREKAGTGPVVVRVDNVAVAERASPEGTCEVR